MPNFAATAAGLLTAATLLSGCATTQRESRPLQRAPENAILLGVWSKGANLTLPRPATSKYFKTHMAGFRLKKDGAHYELFADVIQAREKPLHMVVEFENPLNPEQPIRYEDTLVPESNSIQPYYGPVRGLRMHESYFVKVTLMESREASKPLDQFVQRIRSYVDTQGDAVKVHRRMTAPD
jgi:hypothetical protein